MLELGQNVYIDGAERSLRHWFLCWPKLSGELVWFELHKKYWISLWYGICLTQKKCICCILSLQSLKLWCHPINYLLNVNTWYNWHSCCVNIHGESEGYLPTKCSLEVANIYILLSHFSLTWSIIFNQAIAQSAVSPVRFSMINTHCRQQYPAMALQDLLQNPIYPVGIQHSYGYGARKRTQKPKEKFCSTFFQASVQTVHGVHKSPLIC